MQEIPLICFISNSVELELENIANNIADDSQTPSMIKTEMDF